MIYALFIILTIVYAAGNVLRGSGKIKKVICYAGFAILFAICIYCTNPSIGLHLLAILTALSFGIDWACNSFGWGDFFPHGRVSRTGDFKPAAWLADKKYDLVTETKNWQTLAMSYRFFLTFGLIGTPLLAYAVDSWWYLLAAPLYMLSGIIYRSALTPETKESEKDGHIYNGLLMGSIRGAILFIL